MLLRSESYAPEQQLYTLPGKVKLVHPPSMIDRLTSECKIT